MHACDLSAVEREAEGAEVQAYLHLNSELEASLHDALFQSTHSHKHTESWTSLTHKEETQRHGAG